MNLDPFYAMIGQSGNIDPSNVPRGNRHLITTRPNSPSSPTPDNATSTELISLPKPLPIPSMKRYLTDVLEPMSMYGATPGIVEMWDRLLRDHSKNIGKRLSATDYFIIKAVSPYLWRKPTSLSAWFIEEPGQAGRIDPSRESRLTTGIPLCLEDRSVTSKTNSTEFHVYYCRLGVPMFREGGYTFYSSEEHFFSRKYFPCEDTPTSTIIAVPNYHTCENGRYLSIQPNTFGQRMIAGYSNLALPPLRVWEKEEEEGDMLEPMVGFSWYLNQEESIKKAGEGGM